MSEPEVIPWVRLLTLVVDGPDPEPTVRGAISCRDGDEQRAVGYVRYANGPAAADQQATRLAAHAADLERRRAWFAEQVAPLPLRLELACSVVVHQHDEETGAFQASFGSGQLGMLARRPAGAKVSWSLGWDQPGQRWRDDRWEWSVRLYDEELSESGLAELKRQLGSG